jgi:hypothetical protein
MQSNKHLGSCMVASYSDCNGATLSLPNATDITTASATIDLSPLVDKVLQKNKDNSVSNNRATDELHGLETHTISDNNLQKMRHYFCKLIKDISTLENETDLIFVDNFIKQALHKYGCCTEKLNFAIKCFEDILKQYIK